MPPATDSPKNLQRHYAVFISYRHTDNKELGRQWATWLHQSLETYEIPKDLVGLKNKAHEAIPASLYPVFRDEEELSADADLKEPIRRALRNSSSLVVLCSPAAVGSRFVNEEIQYFKELGKSARVLAMIIYGEPNASESNGSTPELECFPEKLRYGVPREDGTIDWTVRAEPIAADTRPEGRPAQGWTTGAAYREMLEQSGNFTAKNLNAKVHEYEKRLELAKLKVIAGALDVDLGIVTERDKAWQLELARTRARRLIKLMAGFAALALAAIIAGVIAFKEKDTAVQTLSQADFLQAGRSIDDGNRGDALAYLTRSLTENPENKAAIMRLVTLLTYHSWMLPTVILRHSSVVECVQFSPDGKQIVTASDDGTARIWDAQTGKPLTRPLQSDQTRSKVWSAQFSPDGKKVVTGSDDGVVQEWDAQTGQALLVPPIQLNEKVEWAEFSPDGKRIVTASNDGTARIWDAQTGRPVTGLMQHRGIVEYVEFSPDGKQIVTASDDQTAIIWNALSGTNMFTLQHSNIVWSAHFSPDGKWVTTASSDNTARIWNVRTGRLQATLHHGGWVVQSRFSPDGTKVVTASWDKSARIWDARTGLLLGEPMMHASEINSAQFSPDGQKIVTASLDYTARIWDAQTGLPLTEPMKHANSVWIAQFSPDSKRVVTASYDGTAEVWDNFGGGAVPELLQHHGSIVSFQFSPDGRQIITGSDDHTAQVWDVLTGQPVGRALHHSGVVESVQFSPDGKWVVTASADHTAQVWDVLSSLPIGRVMQHGDVVESARFSPDGRRVVTASDDGTARVWDAMTGLPLTRPMPTLHSNAVWYAGFSPDGRRIVTGSGNSGQDSSGMFSTEGAAQIWDAQTGQPLTHPMPHNGKVTSAPFSPNGKLIATSSWDDTARIWSVKSGEAMTDSLKHGDMVMDVQFSPDGRKIVTASYDHNARMWDVKTGQLYAEPMLHADPVFSARFSPDGNWIVTASRDQTVRLWEAKTGQAVIEPLQHGSAVSLAQFSPDGRRIATIATNDAARIWDVIPAETKFPNWLLPLTEAISGQGLDSQGRLEMIPTNRYKMLQQIRQQLEKLPSDDDWVVWGLWFLHDPATRTISPFSQMNVPEYVKNRIQQNTLQSLDEARQMAFANTNLLLQISQLQEKLKMPPAPN